MYNLNNTKQKSNKKSFKEFKIKKKIQTYIVTSAEVKSGYVLRSDLAYDSIVTPDDIVLDTLMNKADHSYSYLRSFERLTDPYIAAPVEPTSLDTQNYGRYVIERNAFITRTLYVNGCHVKAAYTAIAHFWLLRILLNQISGISYLTTIHLCSLQYSESLLITITRTFYNFCWTQKVNGEKVTPAMRFGLATKKYDISDIIYLK